MIIGEFELHTEITVDQEKAAVVRKVHEAFYLDEDEIYQLEFVIKEAKRRLNLK